MTTRGCEARRQPQLAAVVQHQARRVAEWYRAGRLSAVAAAVAALGEVGPIVKG